MKEDKLTMRDYQNFRELASRGLSVEERKEKVEWLMKRYEMTIDEVEMTYKESGQLLPPSEDWV